MTASSSSGYTFCPLDHALGTAAQVEVSVHIEYSHVAGLEPAVVGEALFGLFLVLVVTEEDISALNLHLSRNLVGVGGIDAYFATGNRLAAGALAGAEPFFVGDDGAAFGHAVAYGEGEVNLAQEGLNLGIEGGAAKDDLLETAAEGGDEPVAYLLLYGLCKQRHVHHGLGAVGDRLELGLVDLFHDEGHGDDYVRMNLLEGLHYDLGARHTGQEVHMGTDDHLVYQFEHQTVHMGGREHGHHFRCAGHLGLGEIGEVDIGVERPVGQHDAFGEAGSAGCIIDQGQLLGAVLIVIDVLRLEAFGVFLVESLGDILSDCRKGFAAGIEVGEVVHQDHDLQTGHLGLAEPLPFSLADEEDLGLGVIHEVMDVAGLEFVQDGHRNGAVGKGGEEAHAPVRLVARAEGDFVAFLQAALFKTDVEHRDAFANLAVCERATLIVRQGGAVPMLLEAFLEELVYGFVL